MRRALASIPFAANESERVPITTKPLRPSALNTVVLDTFTNTTEAPPSFTARLSSSKGLPLLAGRSINPPSAGASMNPLTALWTLLASILKPSLPTSVRSADPQSKPLSHARSEARRVSTKLIPDNWEHILRLLMLWDDFSDVPDGLRYGFRIGAPGPVTRTYIPNNHKSALDRPEVIEEHIHSELAEGRYAGPFDRATLENAIGPFQCAPLGVVDKSSSPGKFRVIQDFSFSSNSLNSHIDTEDFPATWGRFKDVFDVVANAPPGSIGGTCDVESAYRQIPVHPDDRPHLVVHWEGRFLLDSRVPFGVSSSNGLFARCGDAMALILERLGFGFILKWVDDFAIIQYPPGSSSTSTSPALFGSMEEIYTIGDRLGWPWKRSKTQPFAPTFDYLGFTWNLDSKWVSIPDSKRLKYLLRVRTWLSAKQSSLESAEALLGTLDHCTQVLPTGRPRLRALIAFVASFPRNNRLRSLRLPPPDEARLEAKWWQRELSIPGCGSAVTRPPPTISMLVMSDASTSFGIGVVIEDRWWGWKLMPGWQKEGRDIGWAEFVALELAVDGAILTGAHDASIICHCDNQGVVGAWAKGRSSNAQQNAVIMRIMSKLSLTNTRIEVVYIPSEENVADDPSRGIAPKGLKRAKFYIPIPKDVSGLLLPFIW